MQITKSCPVCGNVEFKVNSSFENYTLMCSDCDEVINKVPLERYTKIEDTCSSCGNKLFKAKVKSFGERDLWTTICANCGNTLRKYCSDEAGNEITYDERDKYLLKDSEDLYLEFMNFKDERYEIEEIINNLESEIDEGEEEIRLLKSEIHSKEDEIRVLKNELDDRDDEIQELNKRLLRYINNMSELQEEIDKLRSEYY